MSNVTVNPPEDDNGKCNCCVMGRSNNCCERYGRAIKTGILRKKPLDPDLITLLKTNLNRCLNTCDLIAYGLAAMLGGSIYILTGTVMGRRTGPAAFVAYILAGFVAMLNALIYSELACRIPKAGSSYSYAYIILGELPAFLTGWAILLEYILSTSTVARGWSSMLDGLTGNRISNWTIEHIGRLSPPGGILAEYLDFIGVALIVLMAVISCCGVRGSARVTGFFIAINVIVLLIVSIYMFVYAQVQNLHLPVPPNIPTSHVVSPNPSFLPFGIAGLLGGTAICFNAFIGFDAISTCAEEAKTPNKSLPRANAIAVLIVTVVTMIASLALALYFPWYKISVDAPFLNAIRENVIDGGSPNLRIGMFYFVGTGCLIGLSSGLLSNLVAGPRISYAMAQDGLLPNVCADVCEPFKTPVIATTFITILTSVLEMIFSIESLADFLSLGTLIAYSVSSFALMSLRYQSPPDSPTDHLEVEDLIGNSEFDQTHSKQNLVTSTDLVKRTGKPGFLKQSWSRCISTGLVKCLNNGKPGEWVIRLLNIYVLLNILLIIVLNVGAINGLWPTWRIVLTAILLFFLMLSIILMYAFEQFKSPHPSLFRLPLVPFFPCATLSVNMFLISELSWITWLRFIIWLALGLIIYFTYGVCSTAKKAEKDAKNFVETKQPDEFVEEF